MVRPTRSYLICANQRSGTTMLGRALTDTGIAGRPEEYFLAVDEATQPGWKTWEAGPWAFGAPDRDSYLAMVEELGTTPNGVFGAKLMWNNVHWAVEKFRELPRFSGLSRAEAFHAAFPDLHVVNVTRRDRLRQAVSWARAAEDDVWTLGPGEVAPPSRAEYDPELIANLVGLIEAGENGWRELYAELQLTPNEVVYEDLLSDAGYGRAVRGVVADLGLDAAAVVVPAPRTAQQADELNEEWATRFLGGQ